MFPRSLLLLMTLLCAFATACRGGPQPRWIEVRADNIEPRDLHEKCLFTIQQVELKVAESHLEKGEIVSDWDEHLVPFARPRGQGSGGFRRRAHIEVIDADLSSEERAALAAAGKFHPRTVRVRVEKEYNEEKKKPGERTQWEPDEDDSNFAAHIAAMIQNQIMPFEPSDDFNARFGGTTEKNKVKDKETKAGSEKLPGDKK